MCGEPSYEGTRMNTLPVASGYGNARTFINFLATIYPWLRRRIRARMEPAHILLLTTIGANSEEPQTVAVGYFEDGSDLVVVGSNYGGDLHSLWYLNLRAHPEVQVQIEEDLQNMVASTATPDERAHLSLRLATEDKDYGRYQRNTTREIPIVLLHPASLS